MLSRVAESLYWLSRYIERAENVARIIDVNYNLMLDANFTSVKAQWQPLVVALDEEEEFKKRHKKYTEDNVIHYLAFDETNPNSIISCINNARFNARTVRDSISPEMFQEINNIYHYLNNLIENKQVNENFKNIYENIIKFSHLFIGLTERTLLQDEGWVFIRLGRLLERADKITRILDVKYFLLLPSIGYVNTPYDDIQWAAMLKSASAFEPYRKKYNSIEYDKIIEFLILEKEYPRSLKYCVNRAVEMIREIDQAGASLSILKIRDLAAEVNVTNVDGIKAQGLHEYLDYIQQKLNDIGGSIYKDFFFLSFA